MFLGNVQQYVFVAVVIRQSLFNIPFCEVIASVGEN